MLKLSYYWQLSLLHFLTILVVYQRRSIRAAFPTGGTGHWHNEAWQLSRLCPAEEPLLGQATPMPPLPLCHYLCHQHEESCPYTHKRKALCLPVLSLQMYTEREPEGSSLYTYRRKALFLPTLSISICW